MHPKQLVRPRLDPFTIEEQSSKAQSEMRSSGATEKEHGTSQKEEATKLEQNPPVSSPEEKKQPPAAARARATAAPTRAASARL